MEFATALWHPLKVVSHPLFLLAAALCSAAAIFDGTAARKGAESATNVYAGGVLVACLAAWTLARPDSHDKARNPWRKQLATLRWARSRFHHDTAVLEEGWEKGAEARLQADSPVKASSASHACGSPHAEAKRQGVAATGEPFGDLEKAVVIVGSGIGGLAAAAALHKVGIPVLVLERELGPRDEGAAITFWPNAFRVLDCLGLAEPVRKSHPLLQRVAICSAAGRVLRAFRIDECAGGPHEARIVRRAALLAALRAGMPPSAIRYGASVAAVDSDEQGCLVRLVGGMALRCAAVLGADGAKSRLGRALALRPAAYAGEVYYRGLAVFPDGAPEPPGTLRMVWGVGVRCAMSTLSPTEVFWFTTKTCPEGESYQDPKARKEDCLASVRGFAFHIEEAIRHTPAEGISRSRITDRWLAASTPVGTGTISLVGDALHPMTPSLGQGGCTALEDGVLVARALRDAGGMDATPKQMALALRQYERERLARCLPIVVRSNVMGALLQLRPAAVVWLRNWLVANFYPVHSFLNPASFDCGSL